jgi:hypothetical protein
MAFKPDELGPGLWKPIHTFAGAAHTEAKRLGVRNLMYSLREAFSCEECSGHLRQNLKDIPFEDYKDSAENCLLWTYLLHDCVNILKKRKSPAWSEIRRIYLIVPGKGGCSGDCAVPSSVAGVTVLQEDQESVEISGGTRFVPSGRSPRRAKPFLAKSTKKDPIRSFSAKERKQYRIDIPPPPSRGKAEIKVDARPSKIANRRVDEDGYEYRLAERAAEDKSARDKASNAVKPRTPRKKFKPP